MMKGQAGSTKRAGKSLAIALTHGKQRSSGRPGNGSTLGEQAYKRLHADILNGFFGARRAAPPEVLKKSDMA